MARSRSRGLIPSHHAEAAGDPPVPATAPAIRCWSTNPAGRRPVGGGAPLDLRCTGLYENWDDKRVWREARPVLPGHAAVERRGQEAALDLPAAGRPSTPRTPTSGCFPVGTKAWKEFSLGGRRMETRLFEKVAPCQVDPGDLCLVGRLSAAPPVTTEAWPTSRGPGTAFRRSPTATSATRGGWIDCWGSRRSAWVSRPPAG